MATTLLAPGGVVPTAGSRAQVRADTYVAVYRPDTLAYKAYADGRGYTGYDLDLIERVHVALEAAGLPTGAQPNMHYSCAAFGVKLGAANVVQEVGCLFRNPLLSTASTNSVIWQATGWRSRAGLYFHNAALVLPQLPSAAFTGQATVMALGDTGAPVGGFTCLMELSTNFNSAQAWLLGIESQLAMYSHLTQYNIRSTGAGYTPAPRLVVGRVSAALATDDQVDLQINKVAQTSRILNNAQSGTFAPANIYVGGRAGTGGYAQQAYRQAHFLAGVRLTDAQLAIFQPLADYYTLP